MIPHGILMMFLAIGSMFISMLLFWIILFTGKYPKGMWDYQEKFMRYQLRVSARLSNLADGYPAFGLNGTDENTDFSIAYKENINRGTMLVRAFFGIFIILPSAFALYFRLIATIFVGFVAFWIILFTGKYPKGMFDFVVGTGRWAYRIKCYLMFYTDQYPGFTGQILPGENENITEDKPGMEDVLDA